VRLVDDREEVVREVVEQGERGVTGLPAVHVHRVVLDAVAETDLAHHLDVVRRAHPQPLCLQQLALPLQLGQPVGQLGLDVTDRPLHPLRPGHVVRRREDHQLVDLADDFAGQRVQIVELLHLVAEQLHAHGQFFVRRDDLQGVPPDPERAPLEGHVVARILDLHQPAEQLQALDLLVDRRVLLDVGVGLRDVRLGLVVVVVADKILHGVVRQELAQLLRQLGAERLVGGHHQRRPLQALDEPGRGGALAGAGRAEQHRVPVSAADPALQIVDRRGLVAGRLEFADDLETAVEAWDVERHAVHRTSGV
jgi:hypothetical protein